MKWSRRWEGGLTISNNKNPIPTKGMKQKKVHEVQQICPYIDRVWKENDIKTIVDIGAGQGYISRVDTLV